MEKPIDSRDLEFDEFCDIIESFVDDNVYPRGDELDYSRKYTENLKEAYQAVRKLVLVNQFKRIITLCEDNKEMKKAINEIQP